MKQVVAGFLLLASAPAIGAQLLPSVVGQVPAQVLGRLTTEPGALAGGALTPARISEPLGIGGFTDGAGIPDATSLLQLRRERLRTLVRQNRKVLDFDPEGYPVRRDELVVVDLTDSDAVALKAKGFQMLSTEVLGDGSTISIVQPRRNLNLREAMAVVKATVPGVRVDYNHVYEPAGASLQPDSGVALQGAKPDGAITIGLIDGGVAAHPSLATARIEQRGFAGAVRPTGHGTAIASLLVGDADGFKGAARGARLLVGDVYGGSASNGSALAIARALDWLAARSVRVVNISLVGPANVLMERRIAALRARGVLVVAAVGNDGPAAPPMFPASYPGVVAVTAVDAKSRLLVEAGRAEHVDFAAPGADMAAALQQGGYANVRGTSFAAPLVAARLAISPGDALAAVAAEARPTGNWRMGRGVVCESCRNELRALRQKKSS